jgi:hypothetical protein
MRQGAVWGRFQASGAALPAACLSSEKTCLVEAPGRHPEKPGGIWIPPRRSCLACEVTELEPLVEGYGPLCLPGRRILLTEKSHYDIQ